MTAKLDRQVMATDTTLVVSQIHDIVRVKAGKTELMRFTEALQKRPSAYSCARYPNENSGHS